MAADVPVVEIADLPSQPIEHAIGFSNYQVGRTAARYLLDRGFTRIGALAASPDGEVTDHRGEERMRGFEDELRLARLPTDAVLRHGSAPVSFHHGATAFRALVEAQPDIEAIFAVSDLSAVGAVMEAQRMNIRIPQDISIMGFGDFEIGREINPALTTIHVDFRALGLRTGKMLVDMLASDATPAPSVVDVGLRIVERASIKDR